MVSRKGKVKPRQTDARVVEIRDIGSYLTKALASYLTKQSFVEGIRDKAWRVTTSVGLRISERSGVSTWIPDTMCITEMYAQRVAAGSVVRRGSECMTFGEIYAALNSRCHAV